MSGFIRLDVELAHEIGLDAAVLYERIRFRCQRLTDGWTATYAEMAEQTSLSRRRVMQAATKLRELGLIECGGSGRAERTLKWWPRAQNGTSKVPERDLPSLYEKEENQETTNTADAVADESERSMMPNDEPLDLGLPDAPSAAPARTGQTLVARWVDGHRSTGEADAPGPFMKRVAGQCGRLAKDCGDSDDDWRAALLACFMAGRAGRIDPVPLMVKARSQFEQRGDYVARLATGVLNGQAAIENPAAKALGL